MKEITTLKLPPPLVEQEPVVPRLSGALEAQGDALRDLLSGTTSLQAAAERFASSELVNEDAAKRLWMVFFEVAADLPHKHSVLVEFYLALHGLARDSCSENGRAASQLTRTFERYWHEAHDILWASRVDEGVRWVIFNAFLARLLGARLNMALIMFGFVTIRSVLETREPARTLGLRFLIDRHGKGHLTREKEDISLLICAAAQWIIHSGQVIFQTENGMVPQAWTWTLTQSTDWWRGSPGFSRKRWDFWKWQLWCMAKRKKLSKLAKSLACQAVAEMIRIEHRAAVVSQRESDVKDFAKYPHVRSGRHFWDWPKRTRRI